MTDYGTYLSRTTGSGLTVAAYLADAAEFARCLDGRQPTVEAVEGWVSDLLDKGLRPQSIRRKLAAVRRYLGYLGRRDPIARETAAILREYRVAPPVRERDRRPPRVVSEPEVLRLIENAPTAEWRALVAILWGTGARVSEILGRRLAGIPPMTAGEGKRLARGEVVERPGKGGRRRRLVLPPSLRPTVGAWAETAPDDAPLFRMGPQAAHRGLVRLSASVGIPRVNPHAFRHGMKSHLEARGAPRGVIMALLGHGPRNVTDVYGEVPDERLVQAVGGA